MSRIAIFLDRDGVINRDRPDYVKSWSEFEFLPGVLDALRKLRQPGWPVVVVSNQSCIGRGIVSKQVVDEINARMVEAVRMAGGSIDRILICPHHPDEGCTCRKPRPGLLLEAAESMRLDLRHSYVVGDDLRDLEAAHVVGSQPILVRTGKGDQLMPAISEQLATAYHLADNLGNAVDWILEQVGHLHS